MSEHNYYADLEFDLPAKLLEEMVALFAAMPAGSLDEDHIRNVPENQGVYQLFKGDELVYIGKTDSSAGLRKRLLRHARKIQQRRALHPGQVTFKAIRVYVFTAMDLEELLIGHYKAQGCSPEWQNSGFGANDPGRERDTSLVKAGHFDALYPIDLDVQVTMVRDSSDTSVAELLEELKRQLSYNLRYQRLQVGKKQPHPDLESARVSITTKTKTVLEWLREVKAALGKEWQVTALPGYVIVYKEDKIYKSGTRI